MYCTDCYVHSDLCECEDETKHVVAGYCDRCGDIGDKEHDFDNVYNLCVDCALDWELLRRLNSEEE